MAAKNSDMIKRQTKVGDGGFGVVYLGSYGDHKEVGIKDIAIKISDEALDEARMLKGLTHPNIIRYIDIVQERNQTSIIMEFIDGGSLYDYIDRTPQSSSYWKTTRQILIDVAYGMSYLHSRNIVHADLKSLNVLLRHNYSAVICDFGLARTIVDTQTVATTRVSGTERWFAPELCLAKPERSSFTSDIWAYGCVILEIVSKKVPWVGMYSSNRLLLNALAERKNASSFEDFCTNQNAPERIRAILCHCCTWQKNRRPQFSEIIQDLAAITDADLQNINQGTEATASALSNSTDDKPVVKKKRAPRKEAASMPTPKADRHEMNNVAQLMSDCQLGEPKQPRKPSARPSAKEAKAQSNVEQNSKIDLETGRELFKGPRGGWYYIGPNGNKIYPKTDSV